MKQNTNSFAGTQDDLILDICELEVLVQRLDATLKSVDPQILSADFPTIQFMQLLSRAREASAAVQETVVRQIVITAACVARVKERSD